MSDFYVIVTVQAVDGRLFFVQSVVVNWVGVELDVTDWTWKVHDRKLLDECGFVSPHRVTFSVPFDHFMGPRPEPCDGTVWFLDGPDAGRSMDLGPLHECRTVDVAGTEHHYRIQRVLNQQFALHHDSYHNPAWRFA